MHTTAKLLWNISDIWWDWSRLCCPPASTVFFLQTHFGGASLVSESRIRPDKALSTYVQALPPFSLPAFPFGKLTALYGGPECEEGGSISLSPAQFRRISHREKVGFRDDFLSFFWLVNGASSSHERKRKEEPQRGHWSKKRRFFKQKVSPPLSPFLFYLFFKKEKRKITRFPPFSLLLRRQPYISPIFLFHLNGRGGISLI